MNVFDLHCQSDKKWVRVFTRDGLCFPSTAKGEDKFFDLHQKLHVKRNNEVSPVGSSAKYGDFSNINYNAYPVFSERARRNLSARLEGLGKWVALECGDVTYWLFYVTNCVDALSEENSLFKRFSDGRIMRIAQFAFKEDVLKDQLIFTLPQCRGAHYLVTDRFVDLVRQHRLTGFSFEWLWSTDKGPRPEGMKDWEKPRITGLEGLEDESGA